MTPRNNLASSSLQAAHNIPSYDLPSHALLDVTGDCKPSLHFAPLQESIKQFGDAIDRWVSKTFNEWQDEKLGNEQREMDLVREIKEKEKLIQEAKIAQGQLYAEIASEREADSSARQELRDLERRLASVNAQCESASKELAEVEEKLKRKRSEKLDDREIIKRQQESNTVELNHLERCTGLRIEGTKQASTVRYVWSLVNPDEYGEEVEAVVDLSGSDYKLLSHSPPLPKEKLDQVMKELNQSRKVWAWVVKMRSLFREEVERLRAERKARGD
ncbi:hypothetical protein IE81DRAFT_317623 [Ceraceosorus guamensis]|uniref:Kinetochore protein SPC25 n=1 Tax=Ceraceosorus guamensis TaxID=1522189 RepID=A0A316VQ99_9BASI|nr:hypothetical protein IE81DRAFT_317623 [Ceraceosorus guamensis]PWN39702.1 hypothetical protein IE81DRAFT_317623 [Ceraceosorus guamensis]